MTVTTWTPLPFERVEIDGERRDQGLALAGPHLGDLAAMEDDAADHLDVVMALAERALGRLADRGERLGEQVVELLAFGQPLAEQDRLALGSSSSVIAEMFGSKPLIRSTVLRSERT